MIFWHLGATLALVRYVFRDPEMDVRLLLVGALLPDLIDKPIGRVFFADRVDGGRLVGHSLLFAAVLMAIILVVTKRGGPVRRTWLPLAIGALVHLVLDFMWTQQETLFWPFLGWGFTEGLAGTIGEVLVDQLTNPWVVAGEVAGAAYLAWMWRRAGLGDREQRRQFLRTGRLGVAIGGRG